MRLQVLHVGMVLCDCLSKRGEFQCFTGTIRFCRVSKVRVGIRVNIRIRVSLVLVMGLPNVELVELYHMTPITPPDI